MYLYLGLFCVICYLAIVRTSRIYRVVYQYPMCFREMPLVGSLYHFLRDSPEEIMSTLTETASTTTKLGGIARICGLNNYYLAITNASDAADILKQHLNKDTLYTFLQPITGQGSVFNIDYSMSKIRRQAMLPSFSSDKLSHYTDSIWRQSVCLTETLAPHVGKGPFHIGCILGGFCFDNIIEAADIGEIKEEFNSEKECINYTQCFKLAIERWTSLWMQSSFLHSLSTNRREMDRHVKAFCTYADRAHELRRNKLLERKSQKSKNDSIGDQKTKIRPGIFDSLINSKLTRKEISEEILVMFGASDEASIVIYFTLKILGLYPIVQDNVYEELKHILCDSDRVFVREYLTKTPYLDMVIKEVMRLYPPIPLVMRKAQTETILSSGNVIPAGAGLGILINGLHRNPAHWGADAEHFNPERFLPERLAAVPDCAYMPFSSGPRSCPGYKFAHNIVKLALCAILRKYKVVDTPAAGPVPDIRTNYEVTMRATKDIIELVHRSDSG